MKKTTCPVTRSEFRQNAKAIDVNIGGQAQQAHVKEFSTGSLGWNINSKMQVMVGGKSVTVQVGLNVTIVGSKELPEQELLGNSSVNGNLVLQA